MSCRCGVDTPQQAADLALLAADLSPAVTFNGIQAYHGGLQHVRTPAERSAAVAQVVRKAVAAIDIINSAGLSCDVVTGGGSGTYQLEASSGVFTEVQPGNSTRWVAGD